MKPKHRRLSYLLLVVFSVFLGGYLIISSFSDSLIFFYSPNDLEELKISDSKKYDKAFIRKVRVGGLVKDESYIKNDSGEHEFFITDKKKDLKVYYKGILPPIFREGQGIIGQGNLLKDSKNSELLEFRADKLITKHDENYMPPEVKKSIEKYGHIDKN